MNIQEARAALSDLQRVVAKITLSLDRAMAPGLPGRRRRQLLRDTRDSFVVLAEATANELRADIGQRELATQPPVRV